MNQIRNGMAAMDLPDVTWVKSSHSSSQGNCVELAKLSGGRIAMRNSRFPGGPTLIYTTSEFATLVNGAKRGEYDDLTL
jgi:hypothetical protein